MVRYRRNYVPGGTYFFTVTLADRRSRVLVEQVGALRSAFRTARHERPFTVEAIVILPNHLHAILTLPEGDADFSGRWRRIKALFSTDAALRDPRLKPNRDGARRVWQSRFWEHTLRDDEDFANHVDYIHLNPVKHGLVLRARDWPYSSFHLHVRRVWLPPDWAGDIRMLEDHVARMKRSAIRDLRR